MRKSQAEHARAIFAFCSVALLLPLSVAAEGNGIKVSEGRLHPYIELESRYDSNVLYSSKGSVGDVLLEVRPGFRANVAGDSNSLDVEGQLNYVHYLGLNANTSQLSRLYAAASLNAEINRNGGVGLTLTDGFRRSDRTTALSLGTAVVSNLNELGAKLNLRPGGGALVAKIGGGWAIESFEPFLQTANTTCPDPSCDPNNVSKYGYNRYTVGGDVRWKFLPRTAALLEASYFIRQPNDTSVSLAISGLHAWTGVVGLVTNHLAATVKGGYGDTFGSAGVPYSTWLANLELEYVTQGALGGRIGYMHTYNADPGQSFSLYDVHRGYLGGRMLLANRLTLRATAQVDYLTYALANDAHSTYVSVAPVAEYELNRYFYLAAGYSYSKRLSSFESSSVPAFNFTRNEVYLRVTAVY